MTFAIDAIEQVCRTWSMTQDALQVAAHQAKQPNRQGGSNVLANTLFEERGQQELKADIAVCKQAAEDFAILSMWAIFERRLIARLEDECRKMTIAPPDEFNQRVLGKVVEAVEYWRIDEALDLIKPLVGSNLAGQTKQIKRYRDWVAHQNPRKPTPARIDVPTATVILKNIAVALEAPSC